MRMKLFIIFVFTISVVQCCAPDVKMPPKNPCKACSSVAETSDKLMVDTDTNADGCSTSTISCQSGQRQACTLSFMGPSLSNEEKSSINLQCNNDGTWSEIGDETLNSVNHVSCTCTPEPTS